GPGRAGLGGVGGVAAGRAQPRLEKASPWAQMFSFSSDMTFADRAVALSHYYRAVGLRALVHGLEAEKTRLGKKVLDDPRVTVYAGGRRDSESAARHAHLRAAGDDLRA